MLGPNVKSAWVIFSAPEHAVEIDPLVLNCMEMWSALTLQTLTKTTLLQYLPVKILSPHAGRNLNVASPLSQAVQSDRPEHIEADLYKSDDPAVRAFYKERARQFQELRHSDDLLLRNYWWDAQKRRTATRIRNGCDDTQKNALKGMDVTVTISERCRIQTFHVGFMSFNIPRWFVHVDNSSRVHVQCVIADEPDDDRYAVMSSNSEDAARLLIRVCGTNTLGEPFDGTIHTGGEKYVCKANSLFDVLVGRTPEESKALPNRCLRRSRGNGRKTAYTYT